MITYPPLVRFPEIEDAGWSAIRDALRGRPLPRRSRARDPTRGRARALVAIENDDRVRQPARILAFWAANSSSVSTPWSFSSASCLSCSIASGAIPPAGAAGASS